VFVLSARVFDRDLLHVPLLGPSASEGPEWFLDS
jgi:hypothetical protein